MDFWDSIDPRVTGVERAVLVDDREADAAERRASEFRSGRACAREAIGAMRTGAVDLIAADLTAVDLIAVDLIAVGASGAPVWPNGIVGSISHSAGRAAAAVSGAPDILALGIDIERARVFDPDLAAVVCRPDDQVAAAGTFGPSVAFGAKESVFKAWSPLTGGWLEFDDIRVGLSSGGGFDVLVSTAGLPASARWSGRWRIDDGIVRTAAVLSGHGGG